MNNLEQKKSGFTLIEIVITLVVIGILTSVSVSIVFAQIKRQRAQQAINTINYIRNALEICSIANNNNYSVCTSWTAMGIPDPGYNRPPGSNMDAYFEYAVNTAVLYKYQIQATTLRFGVADRVRLRKNNDDTVVCAGFGKYIGFC